ncbi:MAG: D-3-phosphoglycerate dehydrogenase [Firmicutes bacterium]|nr:D-3-phosphoglycerate dehydrogenase [Bacillota bacterium]MDI6705864.1 hydroxyacid dehydrogenase [Bacillota bacterium]
MSGFKIVLSEAIDCSGIYILRNDDNIVEICPDANENTIINSIADADALIVRSTAVTKSIIEAGKKLKVIGRHGIGVDNIDLKAAQEHSIVIVNTPDANILSVAEHVIASMLCLSKRLKEADSALRNGEFSGAGSLPGMVTQKGYTTKELQGKVLGLIGVGKIARKVASICINGFEMKVCGYDAYIDADTIKKFGIEPCSFEKVFVKSDYVSIHVPLTENTKNLISERELKLMKPGAYLINASRGGIVNEDDLYKALKNRKIAGAAIDVYEKEPPSDKHPLFELDNILVTPHIAAMTNEALVRMAEDVSKDVISVLHNETPKHLVRY